MSRDNVVNPIVWFLASGSMMQMDAPLFPVFRLLFHFSSFACYLSAAETRLNFTEWRGAQTGTSQKQGHQRNDCFLRRKVTTRAKSIWLLINSCLKLATAYLVPTPPLH